MNYIKRLEEENRQLQAQLRAAQALVLDFESHLCLPKFRGVDYRDGSRMDWISVGDVQTRLLDIRRELY